MSLHIRIVLNAQAFSPTFHRRFWAKVQVTETCWLWTGCRNRQGYGQITCGGRRGHKVLAHVASWIIHFGSIADGLFVLHDCPTGDNKPCVRPSHLWLGTRDDNMQDAAVKGQMNRGEDRWSHKLTWDDVDELRAIPPPWNFSELARQYGVSDMVIHRVLKMRGWIRR